MNTEIKIVLKSLTYLKFKMSIPNNTFNTNKGQKHQLDGLGLTVLLSEKELLSRDDHYIYWTTLVLKESVTSLNLFKENKANSRHTEGRAERSNVFEEATERAEQVARGHCPCFRPSPARNRSGPSGATWQRWNYHNITVIILPSRSHSERLRAKCPIQPETRRRKKSSQLFCFWKGQKAGTLLMYPRTAVHWIRGAATSSADRPAGGAHAVGVWAEPKRRCTVYVAVHWVRAWVCVCLINLPGTAQWIAFTSIASSPKAQQHFNTAPGRMGQNKIW